MKITATHRKGFFEQFANSSKPRQTWLTGLPVRCKIHMYTNKNIDRTGFVKRSEPYGNFSRETNISLRMYSAWGA